MPEGTSARRSIAHNVVHMRRAPDGDAERVSQLILGQAVDLLESGESWSLVRGDDGYSGWIENRWIAPPPDEPLVPVTSVFAEVRAMPDPKAPGALSPLLVRLPLLAGVRPIARDGERVTVDAGGIRGWVPAAALAPLLEPGPATRIPSLVQTPTPVPSFACEGGDGGGCLNEIELNPATRIPRAAVEYAGWFLGTPYLWGGTTPFGLDCSGLTQLCYRLAGLLLPRDAWMQRDDPRFVPVELSDLAPGDLVFFGKPEKITHVALQWDERRFVHSSGGAGVAISTWGDPPYSARAVDARRLDPSRAADPLPNRKEIS